MAQSGISYAAGQLLAVVAPRTVLVVDAPTDWSLAGPLWELALDDAPVDEILDVLVRRGIRTAPSFAIVRVEGEAVRALVRGSVPVCFERTGEPVRLDATGATTWLEGLISGARRVLVGAVETNSELPYLVSTGVVLVSGLALPCGVEATAPDASGELPQVEDIDPDDASGGGGYEAPAREPVPSGSPYAPAASAPPRVVDLTRSAPRTPAQAFAAAEPASARAFAPAGSPAGTEIGGSTGLNSAGLNGHAPAVFDREPFESFESYEREPIGQEPFDQAPAAFREFAPAAPEETPEPERPVEDDLDQEPGLEAAPVAEPVAEPVVEPVEAAVKAPEAPEVPVEEFDDERPTEAYHPSFAPARDEEPAASTSFFEAAGPEQASGYDQEYGDATAGYADDDYDEPVDASPARPGEPEAAQASEVAEAPEEAREEPRVDPFDDLLIDADEPPGPSPADLPNFGSPSVPVPPKQPAARENDEPSGFEFPQQSRFGSAPAAWPPPEQPRTGQANGRPNGASFAPPEPEEEVGFDSLLADNFRPPAQPGAREPQHQPGSREGSREPDRRELDRYDPLEAYQGDEPDGSPAADPADLADPADFEGADGSDDAGDFDGSGGDEDQQPGSLPFRVRGQSLRPEQRVPLDQRRGLNGGPLNGLNGRAVGNREVPPAGPAPSRPEPVGPRADEPAIASAVGGAPKPQVSPSPSPSGGLLLPSFFRGARAARKTGPDADQPAAPVAREGVNGNGQENGRPWPAAGGQAPPSAWAPPARRGLGDRGDEQQRPADGPPAMPGVLRQNGTPQGLSLGDAEPLREPPRLLGVWCDAGHVTSPDHDTCRVCGLPVPPQAPILVARPPLGVLVFDNGDRVEVDRPVVLGRDPKPVSSPDPEQPILHPVASATGQVSRTHAEVRAAGWDVVVTDLDAMNGTALTLPGQPPEAIEPGVPTVIVPGARVDLGGETGFVFEIEG